MNYAKAAKRPKTRGYTLNGIHSAAEVEFGFELSKEVVSKLLQRFTIDYVFDATEKVCFLFEFEHWLIFVLYSMVLDP